MSQAGLFTQLPQLRLGETEQLQLDLHQFGFEPAR
jgi:hypothetical protein